MRPTLLALFLAPLVSCTSPDDTADDGPDPYDVEIGPYDASVRWTSYGVPHVAGDDYGSLGYGLGYAFARDHVCTLADQVLKVTSQRAKYYGRGEDDAHIDSDFGWLGLGLVEKAEDEFLDLRPELQALMVGYTAGYNLYLEEVGPQGLPEPCRGEAWVQPINHIQLTAYHLHLVQFASGYALADLIGMAQPPNRRAAPRVPPLERLEYFRNPPMGSNGWAIGSERSATGRGMVLSNTHFPSEGERQWYEFHLTVPGEVNVYGVGLVGVPLVNMGFNEHVAWTHTVSTTPRFTAYLLELDPEDPTRYLYDGEYVDMSARVYSIDVLQPDGSLVDERRTLYRSHYGPMFSAPVIGWTSLNAFTYRDVNAGNIGTSDTWFEMNRAGDIDAFTAAHRDHQGIPWVHTMYADDQGNAFYTDSAATPNLSPQTEEAYEAFLDENIFAELFSDFGVVVLEGSDPGNAWVEDPRAAVPGAIPFDDCPQLLRDDYVSNANQNHWIANPAEMLTGYPMLYGDTPHLVTPRTRMNNLLLAETGDGSVSGPDARFDLDELEGAALSFRGSLAQVLKDQVVARCTGVGEFTLTQGQEESVVDLTQPCALLDAWDGRSAPDSVGAHIWREFVGSGIFDFEDMQDQGRMFDDAVDAEDPVHTPAVLAAAGDGTDQILRSLALGVLRLEEAGLPLDAELGQIQHRFKGDTAIPTGGGPYQDGVMAIASWEQGGNSTLLPAVTRPEVVNATTYLTEDGYVVNAGNSWIMAMTFTDDGPQARAVMTYSQSEDPASAHFDDQSWLYADPQLRPILFTEDAIAADPNLEVQELVLE